MQELVDQLSNPSVSAKASTMVLTELVVMLRRQPMLRDTLVANHGACVMRRLTEVTRVRAGLVPLVSLLQRISFSAGSASHDQQSLCLALIGPAPS